MVNSDIKTSCKYKHIFQKVLFLLFFLVFTINSQKKKDVTLVGYVDRGDGIGQTIPNVYKLFKLANIKSRYINFLNPCFNDVPSDFIMHCHYQGWGNNIKKHDKISIAYTNFENTKVYKTWVGLLNSNFDLVVITDKYMASVFEESGVSVPVFTLPLPFDVNKFIKHKKTTYKKPEIFCFGCTAAFWERKNHLLLLEAFFKEFGNDPKVKLKLNGRFGDMFEILENYIKTNNITNVDLTQKKIDDQEYLDYMKSLDCFVLISKGEGFSIPPREAMALNIPCILSNNTAHKIICNSGFVRSVKSDMIKPAKNDFPSNSCVENIGFNFDCELSDVKKALRDVYNNYSKYYGLAEKGLEWVKQYDAENLKYLFSNLIKPKKIILGSKNEITRDYLMTNSRDLYNKYMLIAK